MWGCWHHPRAELLLGVCLGYSSKVGPFHPHPIPIPFSFPPHPIPISSHLHPVPSPSLFGCCEEQEDACTGLGL